MRVAELWRHPVKSMQGEQIDDAWVEADGLEGDRAWGVVDTSTGRMLTGRRQPELLLASARHRPDGPPLVTLPDGSELDGAGPATDAALSAWLDKDVSLVEARGTEPVQAEFFSDATNDNSLVVRWTLPPGRFVDVFPLLFMTTATLRAGERLHAAGAWDVRRFRPNVVVETDQEGWVEDAWVGKDVAVGGVTALGMDCCDRCTMITRPQPGLERDLDVFKVLKDHHDAKLGVWASIKAPGTIRVGDPLTVR